MSNTKSLIQINSEYRSVLSSIHKNNKNNQVISNFNGFSFSGKKIAFEPLADNTNKKNVSLKLNFNNLNSSSSGSLSLSGSLHASTRKSKCTIYLF